MIARGGRPAARAPGAAGTFGETPAREDGDGDHRGRDEWFGLRVGCVCARPSWWFGRALSLLWRRAHRRLAGLSPPAPFDRGLLTQVPPLERKRFDRSYPPRERERGPSPIRSIAPATLVRRSGMQRAEVVFFLTRTVRHTDRKASRCCAATRVTRDNAALRRNTCRAALRWRSARRAFSSPTC